MLDQPSVLELNPLFEKYDLIAKIKIDNKEKLGFFVSDKIRLLEGVLDTKILQ